MLARGRRVGGIRSLVVAVLNLVISPGPPVPVLRVLEVGEGGLPCWLS